MPEAGPVKTVLLWESISDDDGALRLLGCTLVAVVKACCGDGG